MFDLETIVHINNKAVEKHQAKQAREKTLRRKLRGKIAAKTLAAYSLNQLENAAFNLL